MKRIVFACFWLIFLASVATDSSWAQEGGVCNIFSKGVGARQMGLGGAVVAFPKDPTTIFWNPAGMEYLPRKELSLFYATFLEGTSYNFAGFVFPTLNIGTFGIGVSRIATADIPRTEFTSEILGYFGAEQDEFYLSYAKIVRDLFSFGFNFKLERQVFDQLSDLGFGFDVSLMYVPEFDNFFLRDIRVGLTIQNAYSPRLNPGDATDFIPHRILGGIAKTFRFTEGQPITWLLSIDQGDLETMKFRTGLEYAYQNLGMLRVGLNDDGLTFGAGAAYQNFQLDYAYGKLAEGEFGAGHRLSVSVRFGHTREEMLELANARRQREINRRLVEERARERRETIQRLLQEGDRLYSQGDYFTAKVKFSQVLELDPQNPKAEEMIGECDTRMFEKQQKELQERLARIRDEDVRRETEKFIQDHYSKGQEYLKQGDFNTAITEFKTALERDPENQSIKDLIEKAKTELTNRINALIDTADALAKKGEFTQAIQYLNQAQLLSQNDEVRYERITRRISSLETRLNAYDYYQTGLIAYGEKNWRKARINFERARQLAPNDPEIARFYQEAERREHAKEQPFTPEIQKRFHRALTLYVEERYQEAIDIYEELLQIQPYNKRIINALDNAREELKRQQRRKK